VTTRAYVLISSARDDVVSVRSMNAEAEKDGESSSEGESSPEEDFFRL